MQSSLEKIVRALYQDIFDTGNCPAVDSHYQEDAICYFNGIELSIASLKSSMNIFVSAHQDIKTEIKELIINDNKTFARLERYATDKETGIRRKINIMVVKHFEGLKVAKLWFMVDDDVYRQIWLNPTSYQCSNKELTNDK